MAGEAPGSGRERQGNIRRFILLVDDEENITKALTRELEDWADERSHGARLSVDDRSGGGTIFTIEVPRAGPPAKTA